MREILWEILWEIVGEIVGEIVEETLRELVGEIVSENLWALFFWRDIGSALASRRQSRR